MPVLDTLIVRGRSVLRMFGSAETSGAGVADGTLRLYNDGTDSFIQVYSLATGKWSNFAPANLLAPSDGTYLVTTASDDLSAEVVVGATPGGELGGTWASPTVDATHSGSAHHAQDHSARHAENGADELLVEGLGTAGAVGTVPTSDGAGGLSMQEVQGMLKTSGGGYFTLPAMPSSGITVATPASANTYGSWVQFTASAAADLYIVGAAAQLQSGSIYVALDIGTGAGGAETSVGELFFEGDTNATPPQHLPFPIPVASGTRIACRAADGSSSATSPVVVLLCINQADLEAM